MKYNFNILTGNIFDYVGLVDAICITTNGTIKSNGELVMGAGVAKAFYDKYNKKYQMRKGADSVFISQLGPFCTQW